MCLYAKFIKERENIKIIESEISFVTYSLGNIFRIHDMYVVPEFRHSGEGRRLEQPLIKIAKECGYDKIFCTVVPSTANATYNLHIFLKDGFVLDSCTTNLIVLYKLI